MTFNITDEFEAFSLETDNYFEFWGNIVADDIKGVFTISGTRDLMVAEATISEIETKDEIFEIKWSFNRGCYIPWFEFESIETSMVEDVKKRLDRTHRVMIEFEKFINNYTVIKQNIDFLNKNLEN